MGTRAQFFFGNPQDLNARQWLGCVAWDGYPDGDIGDAFRNVKTSKGFRAAIARIAKRRDDFCDPARHGFPFPWTGNLFLTDCTYAFFDGAVQFTWFHRGFVPLAEYLSFDDVKSDAYSEGDDTLPENVPAPTRHDESGPDSIIHIRMVADVP